jgi:hypothetical protein
MMRRPDFGLSLVRLLCLGVPAVSACVGQTGGEAVDFPVAAAGPAGATSGQPLSCANDSGWDITITRATLHIGAVYLNQSQPVSGGQATGCYLTGTYVAQETSPLEVDLLSPCAQQFPALAHGITDPPALIGQVWLTHGDINTIPDRLPMLDVAGTGTQAGSAFPFTGAITIGSNHQTAGGALAGGDPICKERIVTPISAAVTIQRTGGLLLTIDPCRLFTNVDLSLLAAGSTPGTYVFSDDPTSAGYTQPSKNLYGNLRSTGPYAFSWASDL